MSYSKVLSPTTLTSNLVNYTIQLSQWFSTVLLPPGNIWLMSECCQSLGWGKTRVSGGYRAGKFLDIISVQAAPHN